MESELSESHHPNDGDGSPRQLRFGSLQILQITGYSRSLLRRAGRKLPILANLLALRQATLGISAHPPILNNPIFLCAEKDERQDV